MLPIKINLGDRYPFYLENICFIIIFVTFARFIFLTKYHWFAWNIPVKVFLVFAIIPLVMFIVGGYTDFQEFIDNYEITILDHLSKEKQINMSKYIRTQMVFNWVGAFVSTILLPFAMLRSIWLQKNRNKV